MAVLSLSNLVDKLSQLEAGQCFTLGFLLWASAGLSLLLTLVSIWLGFARRWEIIDGDGKSITFWWGLIIPLLKRTYLATDFNKLMVERKKRGVYAVRLDGHGRSIRLGAQGFSNHQRAFEAAQLVAAVSQLPLMDAGDTDGEKSSNRG